jgi:O-antigen ligase
MPASSLSLGRGASGDGGFLYVLGGMSVLALCFVAGGGSRADILSTIVVRFAALLFLAGCFLTLPRNELRTVSRALILPAVAAFVVALQLVPLPHGVWAALPGHARYDQFARLGIEASSWRPLTLTPDMTLNALLSLLPPAAVVCGAVLCRGRQRIWILQLLLGLAVVSALLGIAQLAGGEGSVLRFYAVTNDGSAVGLFANRNHNAVFLAAAIPMLAAWAALPAGPSRNQEVRRWIAICGATFFAVCVLMTGSRAGALLGVPAVIGAILLYFGSVDPRDVGSGRMSWPLRIGLAAVCVAVLGLAMLLLIKSTTLARLAETDLAEEQRFVWLPVFWKIANEFFPFGAGFGSFDTIFRNFEPFGLLKPTYLNEAHNDLLQVLIEGGLAGIALLLAYLVWWVPAAIQSWRGDDRSDSVRLARLGSLITGLVMIASLFDYPLRTPAIAALFAVCSVWMRVRRGRGGDVPLPGHSPRLGTQ